MMKDLLNTISLLRPTLEKGVRDIDKSVRQYNNTMYTKRKQRTKKRKMANKSKRKNRRK